MNARIVGGHAFVAGLFITAWEVAIAMPAGPASPALIVVGLVGPPAVAGVSLALLTAGQGTQQAAPPTGQPVPAPRREVTGRTRRKELSR